MAIETDLGSIGLTLEAHTADFTKGMKAAKATIADMSGEMKSFQTVMADYRKESERLAKTQQDAADKDAFGKQLQDFSRNRAQLQKALGGVQMGLSAAGYSLGFSATAVQAPLQVLDGLLGTIAANGTKTAGIFTAIGTAIKGMLTPLFAAVLGLGGFALIFESAHNMYKEIKRENEIDAKKNAGINPMAGLRNPAFLRQAIPVTQQLEKYRDQNGYTGPFRPEVADKIRREMEAKGITTFITPAIRKLVNIEIMKETFKPLEVATNDLGNTAEGAAKFIERYHDMLRGLSKSERELFDSRLKNTVEGRRFAMDLAAAQQYVDTARAEGMLADFVGPAAPEKGMLQTARENPIAGAILNPLIETVTGLAGKLKAATEGFDTEASKAAEKAQKDFADAYIKSEIAKLDAWEAAAAKAQESFDPLIEELWASIYRSGVEVRSDIERLGSARGLSYSQQLAPGMLGYSRANARLLQEQLSLQGWSQQRQVTMRSARETQSAGNFPAWEAAGFSAEYAARTLGEMALATKAATLAMDRSASFEVDKLAAQEATLNAMREQAPTAMGLVDTFKQAGSIEGALLQVFMQNLTKSESFRGVMEMFERAIIAASESIVAFIDIVRPIIERLAEVFNAFMGLIYMLFDSLSDLPWVGDDMAKIADAFRKARVDVKNLGRETKLTTSNQAALNDAVASSLNSPQGFKAGLYRWSASQAGLSSSVSSDLRGVNGANNFAGISVAINNPTIVASDPQTLFERTMAMATNPVAAATAIGSTPASSGSTGAPRRQSPFRRAFAPRR